MSHIFQIFLKSRENNKTNSKKLRQNLSLTKEFFLENKSRNEPFLLSLSVKALNSDSLSSCKSLSLISKTLDFLKIANQGKFFQKITGISKKFPTNKFCALPADCVYALNCYCRII